VKVLFVEGIKDLTIIFGQEIVIFCPNMVNSLHTFSLPDLASLLRV